MSVQLVCVWLVFFWAREEGSNGMSQDGGYVGWRVSFPLLTSAFRNKGGGENMQV